MANLQVSFLWFDGCPLAPQARANLLAAIEKLGSENPVEFEEVDLMSDSTPNEIRRWGSPTILLNGNDIMGIRQADACGCRIYSSEGGVPTINEILIAIKKAIQA